MKENKRPGPLRAAMIIGSMKAGTTSLFEYLSVHPCIAPAIGKEPAYFTNGNYLRTNRPTYATCFEIDRTQHTMTLDASIAYTQLPYVKGTAENMLEYGITPKLIYLVRDPIDRMESQYNYTMYTPEYHFPLVGKRPLRVSDYGYQLAPFRAAFGRESILIVNFHELIRDPITVCHRVTAFLELPDFDFEGHDYTPRNKTLPTSPERQRLKEPFAPFLRLLPNSWKRVGRELLQRIKPVAKRRMSAEEEAIVRRELAEPIRRFGEEYGVDVGLWGRFTAGQLH